MDTVSAKKQLLSSWIKKTPDGICPWEPSLSDYLNITHNEKLVSAIRSRLKNVKHELAIKVCAV